jgi:hypothetical protein
MVDRVKAWLADGREVRIFTARVGPQKPGDDIGPVYKAIWEWTELHIGQRLEATALKDYSMAELWDDRAVRVATNTGKPCCMPETPEVEVRTLVSSGLNGFAFEMAVESIRQFKDFETHGPITFRLRGVKFTLAYDAESDEHHKERREAAGVPRDDYHWKERPNGLLPTPAVTS